MKIERTKLAILTVAAVFSMGGIASACGNRIERNEKPKIVKTEKQDKPKHDYKPKTCEYNAKYTKDDERCVKPNPVQPQPIPQPTPQVQAAVTAPVATPVVEPVTESWGK